MGCPASSPLDGFLRDRFAKAGGQRILTPPSQPFASVRFGSVGYSRAGQRRAIDDALWVEPPCLRRAPFPRCPSSAGAPSRPGAGHVSFRAAPCLPPSPVRALPEGRADSPRPGTERLAREACAAAGPPGTVSAGDVQRERPRMTLHPPCIRLVPPDPGPTSCLILDREQGRGTTLWVQGPARRWPRGKSHLQNSLFHG